MLKQWGAGLRSAIDAGLNLLYPPVCKICNQERATAQDGFVGPECFKRVRFIEAPFCERCGCPYPGDITQPFHCSNCEDQNLQFRTARAAVLAEEFMLEVIHRYKYSRHVWFEPFLANLLVGRAAPELPRQDWDLIVPIPLHSVKEREREFNQAERLAGYLSRATGIPVAKKLVKRVKSTKTQTMLTREERAENVRGAFAPRKPLNLEGARVILIDDVLTTGATSSACARVLRQGGAADVCVWTLARGA